MWRKLWLWLPVAGVGELLLGAVLLETDVPRLLVQVLVLGGVGVLFFGLLGIIVYSHKHPPLRCPQCGKGLDSRYLRSPGGGMRLTGRESVCCPRCGAMFPVWSIRTEN